MDIKNITAGNVAQAVGGRVERGNTVVCCCPIHEVSGTHNPSLVLTVTDAKRILFHCRSQKCDIKHFRAIINHLVEKCGLPRSHVGGDSRTQGDIHYSYHNSDGSYSWTKIKYYTKTGKKRFSCRVWHETPGQWSDGRPKDAPLLFHLDVVKTTLAACPATPLLIVEGEKDVVTAGELGVLAISNADGAGKWSADDTRTIVNLGAQLIIVCPDNDAAGIDHAIHIGEMFQQAGIEVRWLELPGLGPKEDLSDWVPKQACPDALLKELMDAAPSFDANALDWLRQLKAARPNAGCSYRGGIPNMSLALRHEPHLKGCFTWNSFRHRVEVTRKTPWCLPEWWETAELTPVGYRVLLDADIGELGNYLTQTYDFGACAMKPSRDAIHTAARCNIFDELKDWIGGLPDWDGVARLDDWLSIYAGADTKVHSVAYLALVGSRYVMQVLNRALHPGAKADYSLVFTAPQGRYKDLTFEAMFEPYYREGVPSPRLSQADFALGIAGAMVVHGGEMSTWRKSDAEEQKAALTRRVDYGRRAYGYEACPYPRRACLTFSTNDTEFLNDATGNRRYWVVTINWDRIDIEGLRRDRNQLLAEALARLENGERHWPTPEEEARIIVPERREYMPEAALELLNILERYITEEPLTTRPNRGDFAWKWQRRAQPLRELYLDEFFEKCFGMWTAVRRQGLDRASKRDVTLCTSWLRENGWRRVDKRLDDGQRVRVWRAPEGDREGNRIPFLGRPKVTPNGSAPTEKVSPHSSDTAAATDAVGNMVVMADASMRRRAHKADPRLHPMLPYSGKKSATINHLFRQTQNILPWKKIKENFLENGGGEKIYFKMYWRKLSWVCPPRRGSRPPRSTASKGVFRGTISLPST
jgi:predicted P-loop ATPase